MRFSLVGLASGRLVPLVRFSNFFRSPAIAKQHLRWALSPLMSGERTIVILMEQPLPEPQRFKPVARHVRLSPGACRDAAPKLHLAFCSIVHSPTRETTHQLEELSLTDHRINLAIEEPVLLPLLEGSTPQETFPAPHKKHYLRPTGNISCTLQEIRFCVYFFVFLTFPAPHRKHFLHPTANITCTLQDTFPVPHRKHYLNPILTPHCGT